MFCALGDGDVLPSGVRAIFGRLNDDANPSVHLTWKSRPVIVAALFGFSPLVVGSHKKGARARLFYGTRQYPALVELDAPTGRRVRGNATERPFRPREAIMG